MATDNLSCLPLIPSHRRKERSAHKVLHELISFCPDNIDAFPLSFDKICTTQCVDHIHTALLKYGNYSEYDVYGIELIGIQKNQIQKIMLTEYF